MIIRLGSKRSCPATPAFSPSPPLVFVGVRDGFRLKGTGLAEAWKILFCSFIDELKVCLFE